MGNVFAPKLFRFGFLFFLFNFFLFFFGLLPPAATDFPTVTLAAGARPHGQTGRRRRCRRRRRRRVEDFLLRKEKQTRKRLNESKEKRQVRRNFVTTQLGDLVESIFRTPSVM